VDETLVVRAETTQAGRDAGKSARDGEVSFLLSVTTKGSGGGWPGTSLLSLRTAGEK
jgi:hypothetical protein